MSTLTGRSVLWSLAGAVLACSAAPVRALEPQRPDGSLSRYEFFLPELYVSSSNVELEAILPKLPNAALWERFQQERAAAAFGRVHAFIDPRSGAATNVLGVFPLIPGSGLGNDLALLDLGGRLGRPVPAVDARVVAEAAFRFLDEHQGVLGIDARQLGPVRATQVAEHLWQVFVPQQVDGVRVRDARAVVTISHGNAVVFGTQSWGHVTTRTRPRIAAEKALEIGFDHVGGRAFVDVLEGGPRLELVPTAPQEYLDGEAFSGPPGSGYRHRLVWSFVFQRPPDHARFEVLVDAHSGEVIAFQDTNQYVERSVVGGVYPLTSTEICPTAQTCGSMQTGWPMPFADTGFPAPDDFTSTGGVYDYTSGTATTTLDGLYMRMNDNCGAINASSASGGIDLLGANGQHDCTTPGSGGAGNTAASRSGFYELNKLVEQARGWLPANAWLQSQLTSNMNINNTCNAFYSPGAGTVNFYRSGGGCRNTGELAAVFDHEWGHGLDDNDAGGAFSNSSEAYADIAAIYRLQASCVGHGFFWTADQGCGMTADGTGFNADESNFGFPSHCDTDCSGVRDTDWAKHADNTPDTPQNFACTNCSASSGPCGKQVHCAAAPIRQAAWDLVARDLTAPPFSLDSQSAFVVGNRLFYQGSGNVGAWHACTCPSTSDGCGAANGYMQWLAADDDNGNVTDGTPHMTAIHAAYGRHNVACATPTPTNSGCAGAPASAPALTGTAGVFEASLSWTAAAGATQYWVLRTEGHAGCDFGKAKIAEVAGTSYTDTGLLAGRDYHYNVVAQGTSPSCYTPVSNCVTVTPVACALTCGGGLTVPNDPDQCGAFVKYPDPGTAGACGAVTCSPASGSFFPVGATNVTCTAATGAGCSFSVTVNDTQAPSITCPADVKEPNDPGLCSAVVDYPPPAVSDNCPDVGAPSCAPPSGSVFPVGTSPVACAVADAAGNNAACNFAVTVNDVEPPEVTCSVAKPGLWPPNHGLVNVGLAASATDNCPGVLPIAVHVFGDEDDEMPTGDGRHSPDAKDIGLGTLRLRQERRGDADGRVYLNVESATDTSGNVGSACCTVVVPHSRNAASVASVNAQAAAAQAVCASTGLPPPGYFVVGDGPVVGPTQ